MEFKTGDIVFFQGKSIYSSLIYSFNYINYGEKGFSHVGIITKIKKDFVVIHEALSNGFVKHDYEKWWLEKKIKLGEIEIQSPNRKLKYVYKTAEKYLGKKYAISDLLFILLAFLTKFRISFTGANKLICSEAVSRILYDCSNKKINLSKEFNKPYDLITPMDIYSSKYVW